MNNEKVYIDGYVVGLFADTLGMKGKRIQLANGDIVDIDDNFIHKSIEPKKVEIPQFVAEYIEWTKEEDFHLLCAMNRENFDKKLEDWFYTDDNMELFARAWLDGYEVEKEKRYLVRIIGIINYNSYLNYHNEEDKWTIESRVEIDAIRTEHTRKELEEAGFGWIFSCEGIEVEEVDKNWDRK